MKNLIRIVCLAALVASAGTAVGQESPPPAPKPTAQSEAGEPRASTSPPAADTPAPVAKTAPPSRTGKTTAQPKGPAGTGPAGKGPAGSDRLDLGTATVTGDREQPKVMYIVPWKRSDIGDLAGKPMNSLVDEILSPVDRDVFKREVVYYKAVQADASQNGAAGRQGEK